MDTKSPELENSEKREPLEMKKNDLELEKSSEIIVPELESRLEGDALELEKRIFRNTSELKRRMKRKSSERGTEKVDSKTEEDNTGRGSLKLENRKDTSELEIEAESNTSELEKGNKNNSSELEKRVGSSASKLKKEKKSNTSELEKREGNDTSELEKGNISELEKKTECNTLELEIGGKGNVCATELEKGNKSDIYKLEKNEEDSTSELEKGKEGNAYKLKNNLEKSIEGNASELKKGNTSKSEKSEEVNASEPGKSFKTGFDEFEDGTGDKRTSQPENKLEENNERVKHSGVSFSDETIEKSEEETQVPLLVGETVSIDLTDGEPTVHVHSKQKAKEADSKTSRRDTPRSPIKRMQSAYHTSSTPCDFFLRSTLIVFSTLGWILCVGGVPFVSIAMIAIGSLYIHDCNVQPMIPIYLIVGGVCGTIQHFIAAWNKYLPEESQGRLKEYRIYYSLLDGAMTFFLFIWFILGCVWVYGVEEVDFTDHYKDEYCDKTLYYFAFWLLNVSFMIIAVVLVLTLFTIVIIATSPKKEAVI